MPKKQKHHTVNWFRNKDISNSKPTDLERHQQPVLHMFLSYLIDQGYAGKSTICAYIFHGTMI